jgi:hypothetical protein
MLKRLSIIAVGVIILVAGLYMLFHDPVSGETPVRTVSSKIFSFPFLLVIAGLFASLYGLLHGVRLPKPVYLAFGTGLFTGGFSLVYGTRGIENTAVDMRDILFSPGIALMGAGLYMLIMTVLGKRL